MKIQLCRLKTQNQCEEQAAYRRNVSGACVTFVKWESGGVDGAILLTETTHLLRNLCLKLFLALNNTCWKLAIQPQLTVSLCLQVGVDFCPSSGFMARNNLRAGRQQQQQQHRGGWGGLSTMRSTVSSNLPVHRWNWRRRHRTKAVAKRGSYANAPTKLFRPFLTYMNMTIN